MASQHYTLHQLELASGVPARTLRAWIRAKVVPRPIGRGRATRYDLSHLLRAQAVLALRRKREPLRDIRRQLADLNEEQLAALIPPQPRVTDVHGIPAPPPDPSYPSRTYEVVHLLDGLTLMVDNTRGPLPRRIANEIYRHYAMPAGMRTQAT